MGGISIKQYIRMMHFCFKHIALGLWCGRGPKQTDRETKGEEGRGGEGNG